MWIVARIPSRIFFIQKYAAVIYCEQSETLENNHYDSMEEEVIAQKEPLATIDDLAKLSLQIGMIQSAERVEGSTKLLRLMVSFGAEERQIVAGVGNAYTPELIKGLQALFVTNLAPRTIMGVESHGMIMACDDGKFPVLMTPHKPVAPGASLH